MKLTFGKKMAVTTGLFCLAAVVPFLILSVMAVSTAKESFINDRFEQLKAVREIKKNQLREYLNQRRADMEVLLETVRTLRSEAFSKLAVIQDSSRGQVERYFHESMGVLQGLSRNDVLQRALREFGEVFEMERNSFKGEGWKSVDRLYGPRLKHLVEQFGDPDLLLINSKGDVVYSSEEGPALGQNVVKGALKDGPLGRCFAKALEQPAIEDFAPYAPADNQSTAFMGAPVNEAGQLMGVVALRLSRKAINASVGSRTGLGKSGETYLVGKQEGKIAFRSDMATMGGGSYVIGHEISTPYIEAALSGQSNQDVYTDSSGKLVAVAFTPLNIPGLNWAIITKIDLEEAIAPGDAGAGKDYYANYIEKYGYYDLFLIHPQGTVFYSVMHEPDYGSNMLTGPYADSGLGSLFKQVLSSRQIGLADFAPYVPSNNAPAAFIAQPLMHKGDVELVVALQLPLEAINGIMQERTGMGDTGETYLVGQDLLMRSDSYLDPTHHSVEASFAHPAKGKVDTEPVRQALAGETGSEIAVDYNGNRVLSAYAPLRFGDTTWALLTEMDEREVTRDSVAAANLLRKVWVIGLVSMACVIAVILFNGFVMRGLSKTLKRITAHLTEGSEQVASASSQVSSSSQQLAEGASQQAASLEETTASLEEMASMTRQNRDNALHADGLMKETKEVVGKANGCMEQLTVSMEEISSASEETFKIIKTIDEIAFQTNLLSLNAAVEAARAGEAGAGFAVVADEVRNLALSAAEAAKSTAGLIEQTVKKVENGSQLVKLTHNAFSEVSVSADRAGELVAEIAASSQEQSHGIEQIGKAASQMDAVVHQTASNAEESASAAEQLSAQALHTREMACELALLVGSNHSNGRKMEALPGRHHRDVLLEGPAQQGKAAD